MQRGIAIGVTAIVARDDDIARAQALQRDAAKVLADGGTQAEGGRVVDCAHDEALILFGERDHRAVRPGQRRRFARDEARELLQRKLSGRRETDVVQDGQLLGAAPLALAELPVRVQSKAGARRENQHGERDRAIDLVGEACRDRASVGVHQKERARRGDHAGKDHAREVDRRTGEPGVAAILAFLDPLRAGDADGPHANEPERIDRRSRRERVLDVRGEVEDECEGIQAEPEEERRHRATRLALRHSPDGRERRRGRRHVQERIENGDGRRLRIAPDDGGERRREVQRHRGAEREDDRADVENERVESEPLTVPAEQQDECDRPERRGRHEAEVRDQR